MLDDVGLSLNLLKICVQHCATLLAQQCCTMLASFELTLSHNNLSMFIKFTIVIYSSTYSSNTIFIPINLNNLSVFIKFTIVI